MAKILKSSSVRLDLLRPAISSGSAHCQPVIDARSAAALAEVQAEALLADARRQAERVLAQAQREAVKIQETARQEGYRQGRLAAEREQAILEQQLRTAADHQLEELQARCSQMFDAVQDDLLELALQVAEKILGLELSRNDGAFLSIMNEAMSRFKQGEKTTVKVSQNDYWRSLVSSVYASAGRADEISLLADPTLADGSLIIESASGILDASVPVQLGKIRDALADVSLETPSGEEDAQ